MRRTLPLLAAAFLSGCGGTNDAAPLATSAPSLGPGPRYRPPSLGPPASRALPIRGMTCTRQRPALYGVHLELFAAKRVVLIPPGIGIAPPRVRDGARVRSGRCAYPLRTHEPTGVIAVAGSGLTLGDVFAVWGQPLSPARMAGFKGRVRAYVGGRRWRSGPRAIPLVRHAQIVLEVRGYVAPHSAFLFPPGL